MKLPFMKLVSACPPEPSWWYKDRGGNRFRCLFAVQEVLAHDGPERALVIIAGRWQFQMALRNRREVEQDRQGEH